MKTINAQFEEALSVHSGWLKLLCSTSSAHKTQHIIRVNEHDRCHLHDLRKLHLEIIDDPSVAESILNLAEHVTSVTFGSLSTAMWTASDINQLITTLDEFAIVLSTPIRLSYNLNRHGNGELWLLDSESISKETKVSALGVTLLISTVLTIINRVADKPIEGLEVHLTQHSFTQQQITLFEDRLNIRVKIGSPIRKILIPSQALHQPLKDSNSDLYFACLALLRNEAERLKKSDLVLQIYNFLNSHNHLANIDANRIAQALNMNLRTLNRRLLLQDTSCRGVLEKYKLERAIYLLEAGKVNLTEIAYQLGFSDLSTFSRAFKRWTGRAPISLRSSEFMI